MSLFGSLMGDFENDPIFGMHMRNMRQMNSMMNSLFADPFGMMNEYGAPALTSGNRAASHNSLMPYGFPAMPNINRLLSNSLDSLGGVGVGGVGGGGGDMHHHHSYSSTSVVSMSSGPDGRPQVYRASQSTRTAPGGVRETQQTVCDSRTGTKKMAIGHHIGERAHIIEKEQNIHSGDQEERQDYINIEEDDAEDFNREWETKARPRSDVARLTSAASRMRHSPLNVPAITAGPGPQSRRSRPAKTTPIVSARRSIRPAALAIASNSSSTASSRRPYSPPGQPHHARKNRNVKSVSGPPDL